MANTLQHSGSEPQPRKGPTRAQLERMAKRKLDPAMFDKLPWRVCEVLTEEQASNILNEIIKGASVEMAARREHTTVFSIFKTRIANVHFNEAMEQAIELRNSIFLEEKAFQLAVHGEEIVTEKIGSTTVRTEYPANQMLQFLLKAYKPEVYGIERQEIKAGPLETPPETVKNEADREKLRTRLLDRIAARKVLAPPKEPEVIEAEVVEDDCDDLM